MKFSKFFWNFRNFLKFSKFEILLIYYVKTFFFLFIDAFVYLLMLVPLVGLLNGDKSTFPNIRSEKNRKKLEYSADDLIYA